MLTDQQNKDLCQLLRENGTKQRYAATELAFIDRYLKGEKELENSIKLSNIEIVENFYKKVRMNTVTFEYEFVVDHEDFRGSISCSKKIHTDKDTDDPKVCEELYAEYAKIACEEFLERFQLIQGE